MAEVARSAGFTDLWNYGITEGAAWRGSGDGSLIRLFAFEDAVDDSIWDSGESGELAEAGSLFETGKYYLWA